MSRWACWVERKAYIAQALVMFEVFDIVTFSDAKKGTKYSNVFGEDGYRGDVVIWK
jgi:hypothetical protein